MAQPSFLLSYRAASLVTAALFTVLFAVLMISPAVMFWLFGIEANAAAEFVGRRTAILFIGLAVVVFLGRDEPDSALRRAVATGVFTVVAGFAGLGLIELFRGAAGMGILVAVAGEAVLAVLYLPFCRTRAVAASG
nr:hypothetical protein [uncultured Devosia sp.]